MKLLKAGLSVLVVTLLLALPTAALAGAVVPAGNPAAVQYTEAVPTSHGPAEAERSPQPKHPDQTLGGRNARRLESEGKDGREAARVAAETAPQTDGTKATGRDSGSGGGAASNGGGGTGSGNLQQRGGTEGEGRSSTSGAGNGGSGLAEVAGHATGLDTSEGTGLLLPLAILAIVAWGGTYVLRRRKRTAQ